MSGFEGERLKDAHSAPPVNFWEDPRLSGEPIDLISFAGVFLGRWPFILGMAALGMVLGVAITFLLTPRFSAHAVFLPPTPQVASPENPFSYLLKAPSSAIYTGLLLSNSVTGQVVDELGLAAQLHAKTQDDARTKLRQITKVSADSSGFITLEVTHRDPKLARDAVSAYLGALIHLNDRLALGEATQHRQLFQTQLERAKNDLVASEIELKKAQEASGVVSAEVQTRAGLSAIDAARADIRARQVALAALLEGETEQSPAVVRARSEISAEQAQLGRLESAAGAAPGSGLSAAQAPGVNLRFVQLEREVKYNQVLFDVMAKQFESARLAESSAAPLIQVVDYPELPVHKSWPPRTLAGLAGGLAGFLLSVLLVFLMNRYRALRLDPVRADSLRSLRASVRKGRLLP